MYFSLSEKILHEANSKEEREKWLKTITSVYASEQMRLPVLQEEYQQKLEPLELVVFQSIQNGLSILEIAQQLNIEPSDVTTLFISAKDKIFELLLN